ncbi:hypothetical protein KAR02_11075, partial [Candidatus Bipolaricaulota bacterium]|nr:hypothetical protein [Candidatus Bipolaricaulota bacterium]
HVFQGNTPEVQRIGFRTMSVFNHATAASFEETFDDIGKRFLAANLPWSLDFADVSMTLTRKDARIFLGPVKEEEDWIKATFSLPSENMPPYGIGLDVDGFANVIKNSGKKAVLSTVRTLQEFVQTTEEETLKGMV